MILNADQLKPAQRTLIRLAAGLKKTSRAPIIIVQDSDLPPVWVGEAGYYATRAGTPCRRNRWSIYHRSTLRIYVSVRWLCENIGIQIDLPKTPKTTFRELNTERRPRKININR